MRIAVYSGSFNPLHKGHLAIMEKLSEDPSVGWTYLVVSPKNPLKDGISADTGRERYRAAIRAVQKYPQLKVWVDDIELGMEPPQYTVRTLNALKAREPGNDFVLTIGADNLADIRRWRDYSRILTQYGVMVYLNSHPRSPRTRRGSWRMADVVFVKSKSYFPARRSAFLMVGRTWST